MLKKQSHNDAGRGNSDTSGVSKWDFAIAVRPGWHVTVFTSRSLFVCATILALVALAAVVWVVS